MARLTVAAIHSPSGTGYGAAAAMQGNLVKELSRLVWDMTDPEKVQLRTMRKDNARAYCQLQMMLEVGFSIVWERKIRTDACAG